MSQLSRTRAAQWLLPACIGLSTCTRQLAPDVPPAETKPEVTSTDPTLQLPLKPPPQAREKREEPALQRYFKERGVTGTIALLDGREGTWVCGDLVRCERAVLPASTFKIPHSILALELGAVEGAKSILAWDGQVRPIETWNRDMTLAEAMQVSCVPCFQSFARFIGEERMQEWVTRINFGNADISGGIDSFWLNGGLRVSPWEQIDFLVRMTTGKIPASAATLSTVSDMLLLERANGYVLRGKTGLASPQDVGANHPIGWFVGWVEMGGNRVFFATVVDGHNPGIDIKPLRRQVTEAILRARGVLPTIPG